MTYHTLETADGSRHAYLDTGTGVPAVLLHCSSGSSGAWMPVIGALGGACRTLAPDLLGYGRNATWPRGAELLRDDELAAIDALLGVAGEPVHLVGHSYGGTVALAAAQRFAARVASLTLIEPVAFHLVRGADAPDGWREVAALAERHMALVAQERDAEAAEAFVAYWMGAAGWQQMPDAARAGVIRSMPKVAAEWALMLAAHDDLDAIARIDAPTLLICGGRTRAPARRVMEILRSALPGSRCLEIPDADHMSPLSHPAAVADAVRAHIGSVPRRHRSAA